MIKHYLQVKRLEDDLHGELTPSDEAAFAVLAIGINGDSLATWFLEAVRPVLEAERVLLDLTVDDQDQTHRFLKDGEVIGCVSTLDQAIQGCRIEYLGRMDYRLLAAPEFAKRWFPGGVDHDAVGKAPFLIFNRKDELHHKLFTQLLGTVPSSLPAHYLPSSEQFAAFLAAGLAYGMLPDQQSAEMKNQGRLVDLAPGCHVPVELYWHCWNLKSHLLERLTGQLVAGARSQLSR